MNHTFCVQLACEMGIEAALIVPYICHKTVNPGYGNERIEVDGIDYVRITKKDFQLARPYMTQSEIDKGLAILKHCGYIDKRRMKTGVPDSAYWYGLTNKFFDRIDEIRVVKQDGKQCES